MLTTYAAAEFTLTTGRKISSRASVYQALVTDNGSQFAVEKITSWFSGVGCVHLVTAPRNAQSNVLAEKCFETLKCAVESFG